MNVVLVYVGHSLCFDASYTHYRSFDGKWNEDVLVLRNTSSLGISLALRELQVNIHSFRMEILAVVANVRYEGS